MKRKWLSLNIVLVSMMAGLVLVPTAAAQCADGGAGNDSIVCTNETMTPNGLRGNAGDDTIIVTGSTSITDAAFSGVGGSAGNDSVVVSGNAVIRGGSAAITGSLGNDTIEIRGNATVIDTNPAFYGSTAVLGDNGIGEPGNDLIIVETSVTLVGKIDGDNGTDTLTLVLVTDNADDFGAFQAQFLALNPASGSITVNGKTFTWSNFEQLKAALQLVAQEVQGGAVIPTTRVICDDGAVKVFRLPNGDVQFYSGFNLINVPNGFLVGVVIRSQLPDTLRFQDVGGLNPGWYVEVTQQINGSFIGQVFDQNNIPIGNSCPF